MTSAITRTYRMSGLILSWKCSQRNAICFRRPLNARLCSQDARAHRPSNAEPTAQPKLCVLHQRRLGLVRSCIVGTFSIAHFLIHSFSRSRIVANCHLHRFTGRPHYGGPWVLPSEPYQGQQVPPIDGKHFNIHDHRLRRCGDPSRRLG